MFKPREVCFAPRNAPPGLSTTAAYDYDSRVGHGHGLDTTAVFETLRPSLLGLAYRMLGTLSDAEDIVQETWIRWQDKASRVLDPRAYLNRAVINLCLNLLDSANHKRLEYPNRLPEPIDLAYLAEGAQLPEVSETLTMGFMVLLQELSPAERAVFILHEVFDYTHPEIAAMLEKSSAASRKLLERARVHIGQRNHRHRSDESPDYKQLLQAFAEAVTGGTVEQLLALMGPKPTLTIDPGPNPSPFGQVKNLPGPIRGRERIAAFLTAGLRRGPHALSTTIAELNGRPALLVLQAERVHSVLMLDYAASRVSRVFIVAAPSALQHIRPPVHARNTP